MKGTDESTRLGKDSSVHLMHYDPIDLGSLILIQIILKERILIFIFMFFFFYYFSSSLCLF